MALALVWILLSALALGVLPLGLPLQLAGLLGLLLALAALLWRRSGGNPFSCMEILRALSTAVNDADETWTRVRRGNQGRTMRGGARGGENLYSRLPHDYIQRLIER